MYHSKLIMSLTLRILMRSFRRRVPFTYFSAHFNFPQLSLPGTFTLVVRKDSSAADKHHLRGRGVVRLGILSAEVLAILPDFKEVVGRWHSGLSRYLLGGVGEELVDVFEHVNC